MSGDAPAGCPRCAAAPGQNHLAACPDRPRPDWRDMTPADFDRDAGTVQTALLPAPDPCGTDDLLATLEVGAS